MDPITNAVLRGLAKRDPREAQIYNLRTRIEGAGLDAGRPAQPLFTRILDTALLPTRWQGQRLGEITGYGGEDVKSAVANLLTRGLGVPDAPLFRATLPWFGGGIEVAPTIPGIVGTLADVFNPLDPINWLGFGLLDEAPKAAARLAAGQAAEAGVRAVARPRPVYLGLRAPWAGFGAKPIAALQPGALLGPAREPISRALTEGFDRLARTDIGMGLARRFGLGIAPAALPTQVQMQVRDGLLPLRLFRDSVAEVSGDKRVLETLDTILQTTQESFRGGNLAAVEAARQTVNAFNLMENVRKGSGKILADNWRHTLSGFTEEQRRRMTRALADLSANDVKVFDTLEPELQAAVVRMRNTMTDLHRYTYKAAGRISPLLEKSLRAANPEIDPMSYVPRVRADGYPVGFLQQLSQAGVPREAVEKIGVEELDAIALRLGHINTSMNPRTIRPDLTDPEAINEWARTVFPDFKGKVFHDDLLEIVPKHIEEQLSGIGYLDAMRGITKMYEMPLERARELIGRASPEEKGKWAFYTVRGDAKKGLEYVLDPASDAKLRTLLEGGDPFLAAAEEQVVLLPKEIAQYSNMVRRAIMQPEWAKDGIGKAYQSWLSLFKVGATLPFPGYWARNKLGDLWLMWLGGIDFRNTRAMTQAAEILREGADLSRIAVRVGGQEMSAKALLDTISTMGVLDGFFEANLRQGVGTIREMMAGTRLARFTAPFDTVERLGRKYVDQHSRLWYLLDRLDKGASINDAVAAVKKHLFDYTDLTPFEKTVMRSLIPFYSWIRKNVPHQIEQLARQPGKFTTMRKWQQNLSAEGFEGDLPLWMKEGMPIGGRRGGEEGFGYIMPRLPYEDLGRFFTPAGMPNLAEVAGTLNPLTRLFFEAAVNRNLATGIPIQDRGEPALEAWLPYVLRQTLPRIATVPVDAFTAATGMEIPGLTTAQAQRRIAAAITPFTTYPADRAREAMLWEERERLLDLMARYERRGRQIPTLQELGIR